MSNYYKNLVIEGNVLENNKNRKIKSSIEDRKLLWESLTLELTNKLKEKSRKESDNVIEKNIEKQSSTSNISKSFIKNNSPAENHSSNIPPPPPLPKHCSADLKLENLTSYGKERFDKNVNEMVALASSSDDYSVDSRTYNPHFQRSRQRILNHKTNNSSCAETSKRECSAYKSLRSAKRNTESPFIRSNLYLSLPSSYLWNENQNINILRKAKSQFIDISDSDSSDLYQSRERNSIRRKKSRYQHLQTIKLCHKKIKDFPEQFLSIPILQTLDLSWNQISSIPEIIHNSSRLKILHLAHNRLQKVNLGSFRHLRKVDLSANVIQKFPQFHSKATLNFLDLSDNQIWNLNNLSDEINDQEPEEIRNHGNETEREKQGNNEKNFVLKLCRNRLTGGIVFHGLQHVTDLDVSENGITSLEVTSLAALTSLKCSNNDIVTISLHGALLESLIADRNRVTCIRVKNHPRALKHIDVAKNSLVAVPPWLVSCNMLEYCDVSRNSIYSLPAYVTSGHLAELKVLKANNNMLKVISSADFMSENSLTDFERRRICNLEVLSIHHNFIQNLSPNFFKKFSRLRTLNISSNEITKFPDFDTSSHEDDVIGPALQELYAADNQLTDLAPISGCQSLRILHLPFNKISAFPESLCWSCDLLEEVVLSGNYLLKLPPVISRLKRLRVFKVHLNPIQQLPKLSHLTNLKVIDASHCRLGVVDFSSIVGPSLTSLDMAFNPSLVVDRKQFSKCKSERPVSVVNTTYKRSVSFPFIEAAPNSSSQNICRPSQSKPEAEKCSSSTPQYQGNNTMPWKIGFSESIGKDSTRLTVSQLRVADFGEEGRIALVGVADGGKHIETASNLLKAFPNALQEERLSSPDLNDALKYSLLSCLRKAILDGENLPVGFLVGYLEVDQKRDFRFNSRSSVRTLNPGVGGRSLRLCYFGDIKAIVCTSDGPPVVISTPERDSSFVEALEECKPNDIYNAERLSFLPNPNTMLLRLNNNHRSLIIASSNLWQGLETEEISKICQETADPTLAAKKLLTLAQAYGTKTSLSILIVNFPSSSARNTYQYSSLIEKKANNQPKAIFSRNPNLYKNPDERCLKPSPYNDRDFSDTNYKEVKVEDSMDRYPPSGQSDNEDSVSEITSKPRNLYEKLHSDKKSVSETKYPQASLYSTIDEDSQSTLYDFDCSEISYDLISPPAGFADLDGDSLGSDSGFSGHSEGKLANFQADHIERLSNASKMSDEKTRSWEYAITRNPKVNHLRNFLFKKNKMEGSWSSSVPNLSSDIIKETSTEADETPSQTPRNSHQFERIPIRKSRFARGAVKLLQNKLNLGSNFISENFSKLRGNSDNFKRYGSLQNLKYYQNNKHWCPQPPKIDKNSWSRSHMNGEIKERSNFDTVEFESRMQHYWNTGVTCF